MVPEPTKHGRTAPSIGGGETELPQVGDTLDVVHEETDGIALYPRGIEQVVVEDIDPDGYYSLAMLDEDGRQIAGRHIAEYRVRAILDAHDGAYCVVVPDGAGEGR